MALHIYILGAAAEDVQEVEQVVAAPFRHQRLQAAYRHCHVRVTLLSKRFQKSTNLRLPLDQVGVDDMRVFLGEFDPFFHGNPNYWFSRSKTWYW